MTDKLPPQLLALFAPRPQLRYLPPSDHAPEERNTAHITGVAQFLPALKEKAAKAKAAEEGAEVDEDDPYPETKPTQSKLEERNNRIYGEQQQQKWLVEQGWKELYKPRDDPNIRGDPFKTLFVGRLDYNTEARDLEKEFGRFGPIERVKIVLNNGKYDAAHPKRKQRKNKPRGYAFIVFEDTEDFKAAFKASPTAYIKGRSVIVDAERGRTTDDWKPRRFGGGKGGRHYTKEVARPSGYGYGPPSGPGFGRGGFRGGFDRGGGFRGGRGGGFRGGRGGIGYGGPDSAPRGPGGGGYGGRDGGYGGRGGGGGYDDRPRNANFEPLPPRGGYRDRDRDRDAGPGGGGGGYGGHKRPYEGGYDESRSRRRY